MTFYPVDRDLIRNETAVHSAIHPLEQPVRNRTFNHVAADDRESDTQTG
jgi:hypothetical protein